MKKVFGFGVAIFFCNTLYAAGGDPSGGVPWSLIAAQSFNFTAFIIFLVWLLRTRVREFFTSYRQNFLDESSKAQGFVVAVEKKKKDIQERLENLETTYSSKMESAKKEAQALKKKLILEANQRAKKMISEASDGVLLMFKSAERAILQRSLDQAMNFAKKDLSEKVRDEDAKRLHLEFLKEIEGKVYE